MARVRAAASSMASGRPSSRRHSSTTSPIPSPSSAGAPAAAARSRNSSTAGERWASAPPGAGSASGSTTTTCSPGRPSGWRLVQTRTARAAPRTHRDDHVADGPEEVLAVVEHDGGRPLGEGDGGGIDGGVPERIGHGIGRRRRRERAEPGDGGVGVDDGPGQPRLADTAGSGQRHQRAGCEQRRQPGALGGAADQPPVSAHGVQHRALVGVPVRRRSRLFGRSASVRWRCCLSSRGRCGGRR